MLLRFRTMSAAVIAGVMILDIGVAEARSDVIYSTGGQGEIIDTVVGFRDMSLPDLRNILAGDCEHKAAMKRKDQCQVFYPQLREMKREGTP